MFDLKYSINKRALQLERLACYLEDALRTAMHHRRRGGPVPVKMLLLSDEINFHSECQFDPIIRHRDTLRREFGLAVRRLQMAPANIRPSRWFGSYDIIGLKFNYKTPEEIVLRAAESVVKSKRADARLVYCDGNDELTIQWPELLDICDIYWKKHFLRDRFLSLQRYPSGTNLTDHVVRTGGDTAEGQVAIAPDKLDKLRLGASIGLDDKIAALLPYLENDRMIAEHRKRTTDVILRADVPDNWMGRFRKPAVEILQSMRNEHEVLLPTARVPQEQYIQEMMQSRICVSPFGYGEICWRDFEAVAFGCLLIKPDMDHVESRPDIFRPFETYVPVKWDFSDLREKISHYLNDEPERMRIASNARRILRESMQPDWFVGVMRELLDR